MCSAILRDYAAVLSSPFFGLVGLLLLELDRDFSSFWVVVPELLKFFCLPADSGQLPSCLWLAVSLEISQYYHQRSGVSGTAGLELSWYPVADCSWEWVGFIAASPLATSGHHVWTY